MQVQRLKLRLHGTFSTPWHADTVFGSLCWVIAHSEGDAALHEFLGLYHRRQPPFVLSNGFPGDLLTVPMTVFRAFADQPDRLRDLKKLQWLTLDQFHHATRLEPFDFKLTPETPPLTSSTVLHNTINRLTGATGSQGALYEVEETATRDARVSIYLKIADGWHDRVVSLFRDLARVGFGKDKSAGKGAFEVESIAPFDGFEAPPGANGFVSLSNFVPACDDPTDGAYELFVKQGKLGEELARSELPFKKGILMLRAGAAFRSQAPPQEFYGRIVPAVSAINPAIVQYGLALAVPIRYG